MKIYSILLTALTLIAITAPCEAEAAVPGFALSFKFEPPFTVTSSIPTIMYLDVCASPDCSFVTRSFTMNCAAERAGSINRIAIVGCTVQAASFPRFFESPFAILSHPVNLRVRSNNLVSQVFPFPGGQALVPEPFYNFLVSPGASGFLVTY